MKKPNFFIVGAPKCGTTALYNYLKHHPDIFLPEFKEPHFFGKDILPPYAIRDEKKYLSLFSNVRNEKRIGEASVWYLYSKKAATEIKEYCPSVDFIIMLRNPVDMMYSLHSQRLYTGRETIEDFEQALEASAKREYNGAIPRYQDVARFTEQVQRYFNVFGRDKVHIIIYDDFKRNTLDEYLKTLDFLGVERDHRPNKFKVIKASRTFRNRYLQSLMHTTPPWVHIIGKMIPSSALRETLFKIIKSVFSKVKYLFMLFYSILFLKKWSSLL